jgi:putative N6-adenine-specific DNA methylase
MQDLTAAAFCAVGAEKVVSNELKKLSPAAEGNTEKGKGKAAYTVLESGFGRVRFKTDLAGLYRALFSLRAADRLLLEAGRFPAPDFDALFEGTRQIPWEDMIKRNMALTVSKVRCSRSRLMAETSVQAVVHKAAAERLCSAYGLRRLPEKSAAGNAGVPQAELRVFIEKDTASVLLDLCGEPLFKRGYRPAGGIAPLRESTAAAIILLSGWKRKFPLWDPLCGSGTIVIEAALYAWDQAPGLGRRFALSDLSIAEEHTENAIRRELAEKADYTRPVCIRGSDADERAVTLARANLRRARGLALPGTFPGRGLSETPQTQLPGGKGVEINCLPLEKAGEGIIPPRTAGDGPFQATPQGFIITNPPYGKRLGDSAEAEARYRDMAALCGAFPGWKLALISDHRGFESHFGRKADSCREIKSGAADAWLYQYEKL